MARNWKYGNISNGVTLALPVPVDSQAGWIVPIGDEGLMGYMLTDRATDDTVQAGTSAPGLASGEASVLLLGVDFVIEVEAVIGALDIGDAVETDGEGDYGAAEGIFVGYAVTAKGSDAGSIYLAVPGTAVTPGS